MIPLALSRLSIGARVAAVLAAIVLVLVFMLWRSERGRAEAVLARVNAEARADTSRTLAGKALDEARKLYGDSVAVVTRLVVQERQRSDGLDRELRQTRVALASLTVAVRNLDARVGSSGGTIETPRPPGEGGGTVRSASFDVREAPYTVHADVTLPPAPEPGRLAVKVSLDTARIALRLGCSGKSDAGIRSAQATAVAPEWLAVNLSRVEADPVVCNGDALGLKVGPVGFLEWLRNRVAVSVGPSYGVFWDVGRGKVAHGPGLAATWRLFVFP